MTRDFKRQREVAKRGPDGLIRLAAAAIFCVAAVAWPDGEFLPAKDRARPIPCGLGLAEDRAREVDLWDDEFFAAAAGSLRVSASDQRDTSHSLMRTDRFGRTLRQVAGFYGMNDVDKALMNAGAIDPPRSFYETDEMADAIKGGKLADFEAILSREVRSDLLPRYYKSASAADLLGAIAKNRGDALLGQLVDRGLTLDMKSRGASQSLIACINALEPATGLRLAAKETMPALEDETATSVYQRGEILKAALRKGDLALLQRLSDRLAPFKVNSPAGIRSESSSYLMEALRECPDPAKRIAVWQWALEGRPVSLAGKPPQFNFVQMCQQTDAGFVEKCVADWERFFPGQSKTGAIDQALLTLAPKPESNAVSLFLLKARGEPVKSKPFPETAAILFACFQGNNQELFRALLGDSAKPNAEERRWFAQCLATAPRPERLDSFFSILREADPDDCRRIEEEAAALEAEWNKRREADRAAGFQDAFARLPGSSSPMTESNPASHAATIAILPGPAALPAEASAEFPASVDLMAWIRPAIADSRYESTHFSIRFASQAKRIALGINKPHAIFFSRESVAAHWMDPGKCLEIQWKEILDGTGHFTSDHRLIAIHDGEKGWVEAFRCQGDTFSRGGPYDYRTGEFSSKYETTGRLFVFEHRETTQHGESGTKRSDQAFPFGPMFDFVLGGKKGVIPYGPGEEYVTTKTIRRYAEIEGAFRYIEGEKWLLDEEGTPLIDIGDYFHKSLDELKALNPGLSGVYCSGPLLLSRNVKPFDKQGAEPYGDVD